MAVRRARTSILVSLAVLSALSCAPSVGDPVDGTISGTVVKGPVAASNVQAFSVSPGGRRDAAVGEGRTDDGGSFTLNLGGHFGPTLVCAKGGAFTEEATGGLVDLGPNELCALIDAQELGGATSGAVLTPLTTLHANLTACLIEAGREQDLQAASDRAANRLNQFLSAGTPSFDLRATPVFDPTTSVAPSLTADVWHGLLLAGLSESARQISLASDIDPGVRVTSATLTTELARDIDDGRCVFDGHGPGDVALGQGAVALSSNTLRGAPQGLALSIERFLVGTRNQSGVALDSVADLTRALATHKSDIFGDDTNATPPTISMPEPTAGPVAGTPPIRVIAEDVVGITTVAFIAPNNLAGTGELTCATSTHCELAGTLNTGLFAPGDVTITARATNTAGISSDVSVTVTVDNELPEVVVSAPSPGTCSGTVDLLATATSTVGVASFNVDVPGVAILPSCAPPVTTTNCDREPDPTVIDVLWDTTVAPEGPLSVTFAATDTAGKTTFRRVDVEVDNIAAGTIGGVVELGFPVVGAAVTAFELTEQGQGAAIGTDVTDEDGRYEIVNAEHAGPVLVVASGGTFEDSATGQPLSLRAGQELTVALAEVALGEVKIANVNAWTTLASERALVTQGDSPSIGAAVTFNSNLLASHLLRPGSLSLAGSVSANLLEEDPAPSDSSAILALAHGGLSRVAAQLSIDIGGAPGQVTPVDLLDVLKLDLSDGVLDGTDSGALLFLDQQSVASDSYVLRTTLAVGIDNFVKNAPLRDDGVVVLEAPRNASGITSAALSATDLLYDDLSLDRSALFPLGDPVRPFDQTPPTIELAFAAPNDDADFGDPLEGVIAVIGIATDPSGLSAFNVLAPQVSDLFSPVADVRVEIDGSHAPNRADVLDQCGVTVGDPPYEAPDADRQVCVCLEAIDALENIAHDVQCFTRPRPVVTTDAVQFVGPARTALHVAALGSFDLTECSAVLTQQGSSLGAAIAAAAGNACDLTVPVAASLLPGTATLDVDVTEVGGAVSRSSFTYTVDLEAPALAFTAPVAGSFHATPPTISATVGDDHLASVTMDVTTNATPIASGLAGTVTGAAVAFPSFVDEAPDGLRTVTITATDAAGNTTAVQRSYTKDTTAPSLANLTAADGNALRHFQLTATTAYSASAACSAFPFTGCIFDIAAATSTEDVDLHTSATSVETYRRWQHLAGAAMNPSTRTPAPAEDRAPTLRLKTEPGLAVQARIDATCPADVTAFENRPRASFMASSVGMVDVPLIDAQGLTTSPTLLRTQTGQDTLCLTMRVTDQAGNMGGLVNHFFKYEATPVPLFMVWNARPYTPGNFAEDVEAFDDGDDDDVLSGSGQGAAGRVFAHAYLVSPSTLTNYNYSYSINAGAAPTITVAHREVVQVSKVRAFNWCYTLDGTDTGTAVGDGDDDLVNPDCIVANEAGSPPNNPTWSGAGTDQCSASASWALFSPTGGSLLGASAITEHRASVPGETDTTFAHDPAASYSTSADTTEVGQTFTFSVPLQNVTLEVWSFNTASGLPGSVVSSGATVSFTAGGGSAATRHRLLVLRAPVPTNAITLKTAQALNNQAGTIGFNDSCSARDSTGALIPQAFTLPSNHWVVADQGMAGVTEPAPPHPLLWVRSGSFTECRGSSTNDCRYGRYFDDYLDATWTWPAGRALQAQGQINGVTTAAFAGQPSQAIPAGQTRRIAQEP